MPTCSTRAWTRTGIPGLACFRAANLVPEYSRHGHSTWAIPVVDDRTDGIWYRGVKVEDASELVNEHFVNDRLVARLVDAIMQ